MEAFYLITCCIATLVLVLILGGFWFLISRTKTQGASSLVYPNTSNPCPDYWKLDSTTNTCVIPTNGYNVGIIGSLDVTKINGYNSSVKSVDFNASSWSNEQASTTCNLREWANKNSIIWDGITNYNGC